METMGRTLRKRGLKTGIALALAGVSGLNGCIALPLLAIADSENRKARAMEQANYQAKQWSDLGTVRQSYGGWYAPLDSAFHRGEEGSLQFCDRGLQFVSQRGPLFQTPYGNIVNTRVLEGSLWDDDEITVQTNAWMVRVKLPNQNDTTAIQRWISQYNSVNSHSSPSTHNPAPKEGAYRTIGTYNIDEDPLIKRFSGN